MQHPIAHEENDGRGAFYIEQEGKRIAAMTYRRTNAALIDIDHTNVDPSLGGQGIGRSLLDALVQWARATQTRVTATCSYAKAQFARDASIRDVLG